MKLTFKSSDLKRQERKQRLEERRGKWHNWYAWRPVRVNDSKIAWLETVVRKYEGNGYEVLFEKRYQYRDYHEHIELTMKGISDEC